MLALTAAKLSLLIRGAILDDAAELHELVQLKLLCLDAHTAGTLSREELFSLLTEAESRQLAGKTADCQNASLPGASALKFAPLT